LAAVVVEFGGKEVMRVPLKGPSMVIGRDPATDVHLDNRALSRRHAQIEKRGAAIWVRDLGSQNGTYVNGSRIAEPQPLNGGDVIELGRYRVMIEGVDQAKDDTPVLTLTGPEGKHRFAMVGDEIIIGRAPSCDIAIGHKSISRRHLRISLEAGTFLAEDLGSQNGTGLHGKRINGPTAFQPGDQLQMSDFTIELGFLHQEGAKHDGAQAGDRASKTMMIDRSELAKAAYVDGDFERMRSAAGRLALGRPDGDTGRHDSRNGTGEYELDDDSATRGVPEGSEALLGSVRPALKSRGGLRREARVTLAHPDIQDKEVDLTTEVTVVGEDGSIDARTGGRSYADQGYLLLTKTPSGVVVSVTGDRRLVTVNGRPELFAPLSEGDTVEFGLLTAIFHSAS
jgi:pSer/pThr/pTyr-binding forkhead associated (FHA) protein